VWLLPQPLKMLTRFLQCCNTDHDPRFGQHSSELRVVELSSDVMEFPMAQPVHLLTRQDSMDMTLTPRSTLKADRAQTMPATPRQQDFTDRIMLPRMRRYPLPPGCTSEDTEEHKLEELLRTYREFVLDLHKGMHMTQLSANQDYSDIHCQVLEDLQTLKVDQGSGCIVEFPLSAVSKVYRIVKNDDNWHSAGSFMGPVPIPPLPFSNAEHIVVIEFMRRKLALVFNDMSSAQRFLVCIELLTRRVQETRNEGQSSLQREMSWRTKHSGALDHHQVTPLFASSAHSARRGPGEQLFGGTLLRVAPKQKEPPRASEDRQICACQPATPM